MQVGASLAAHGEAPELVQPGKGALDYPVVPSQRLAVLDAAGAALAAATTVVAALVGVQLARAASWPSTVPGSHAGTASSAAASIMLSLRLAPLSVTPSGVPWASVTLEQRS